MLTGQGESDSLERLAHIGNERSEISVYVWSRGSVIRYVLLIGFKRRERGSLSAFKLQLLFHHSRYLHWFAILISARIP